LARPARFGSMASMDGSNSPIPKPRWYRLTPDRLLVALLAAVALLFLADRLELFGLQRGSGWNVLTAVGLVLAAVLVGLFWFGVGLLLKRPFQFSLRSLLLFVLACAVACSWIAKRLHETRREQAAMAVYGCPHGYHEMDGPDWITRHFRKVRILQLVGRPIPDYDFVHLRAFSNLQELSFSRSRVGDADLVHLKGLTSLEHLSLYNTKVTDAGLVHLKGLTSLKYLNLFATKLTDAGLVHLKGLTSLESLLLDHTKVTDAGLVHLRGLTNLKMLDFRGTQITDDGLQLLKGLTKLKELRLQGTQVTDEGVKKVQEALPNCDIFYLPLLARLSDLNCASGASSFSPALDIPVLPRLSDLNFASEASSFRPASVTDRATGSKW